MRGALAIFTKTPELSPVKTRLAKDVGEEVALNFFSWGVRQIAQAAMQVAGARENVDVFWALAEEEGLTHERWANSPFQKIWSGDGDLDVQMHRVTNQLLDEGYDYVMITGTDIPDLTPRVIVSAIDYLEKNPKSCVLGPTGDGGFYFYGSNVKSDLSAWTTKYYKEPEYWKTLLSELKLENTMILPELMDVDEAGDFEKIKGAI